MSEKNELVKPEGITQDEWDAAPQEMRERLVEEAQAKAKANEPDVKVAVVDPKKNDAVRSPLDSGVAPEDPINDPQRRQPVAPKADEFKNGRSAHEIANAAAKGQDIFPGEDGEIDREVDPARVATAGP